MHEFGHPTNGGQFSGRTARRRTGTLWPMAKEEIPFFIVGSARSGTTLLRLMLNAHPEVAVPPESRFITQLWPSGESVEVEPLLEVLAAHPRFAAWDLPIDAVRAELEGAGVVPYAELIRGVFRAYAHAHGKSRWGDKTPRYVEHIALLSNLLPDARFIHLIRDGRNVALSYADVPFGPKTVARAADLWARRVSGGIEVGASLGGGRYLELLYEDLVADPAGEAGTICKFLDLDFHDGMLDPSERAHGVLSRAAQFNPNLQNKPISEVRSWERVMPPRQIEMFEAVAGGLLSQLGYPRRYSSPRFRARVAARLSKSGLPVGRLKPTRRPQN
jgi:Sulfotransferase family